MGSTRLSINSAVSFPLAFPAFFKKKSNSLSSQILDSGATSHPLPGRQFFKRNEKVFPENGRNLSQHCSETKENWEGKMVLVIPYSVNVSHKETRLFTKMTEFKTGSRQPLSSLQNL